METDQGRYGIVAIGLHWLTAAAIFTAMPLGMMLEAASPAMMDTLYRLHWSFGFSVLFLAVLRLGNRLSSGMPEPHGALTRFERLLSAVVHKALYLLMFVVPMLGWAGKSAYGGAITVFGMFDLPAIVAQDEKLSETLLAVHGVCARLLVACIVLHVAGALKHAIINRDGVFSRMLPWGRPSRP